MTVEKRNGVKEHRQRFNCGGPPENIMEIFTSFVWKRNFSAAI